MSKKQALPENIEILKKAKTWFKDRIVDGHIVRTEALKAAAAFNINPFTASYLSAFLTGGVSAEGIAKALVYPRILGTSISTSFGQNLQSFISDVLGNTYGSLIPGIDISFIDKTDGRQKHAQLKLGPNTINADDVTTIHNHFKSIRNLARTNQVKVDATDLVVCVMYGTEAELSSHYKSLRENHQYPLFVGTEFWHRLTGDGEFFARLVQAISQTLGEVNASKTVNSVIHELANTKEIQALVSMAKSAQKQ